MSDSSRYTLTVEVDGQAHTFSVGPDPVVVGRSVPDGVTIDHASVSRRHCELTFADGEIEVRDLASSNGTFVNGNQIIRSKASVGDELRFGQVDARLAATGVAAPAEPSPDDEIELEELTLGDEPTAPPPAPPAAVPAGDDDLGIDLDEISLDDEPVASAAADSGWALVVVETGERFALESRALTIGRSSANDLVLKGLGVSGKHAAVEWRDGRPILRDVGSTNGVLVDGRRVETIDLYDGTAFQIGKVAVRVEGTIKPPASVSGVEEISLDDEDEPAIASDDQPTIHHLADTDVPKRSRAGLIVVPLLLVGLAGAAYVYFRPPAAVGKTPVERVDPPSDSLIQAGFSAEEADATERWEAMLVGAGSDFARVPGAKRSGRFGFELTRSDQAPADQPTIAAYKEPIAVDSRRRYSIEAFGRRDTGDASAALLVRFLDENGAVISEEISPRVDGGAFEAIELSPTVPVGCATARVAIVATGGAGVVHIDDVTMRPSELAPQTAEHAADRFNVLVAPSGAFSVRDESDWLLMRAEYFVIAEKLRYGLGLGVTTAVTKVVDNKTRVEATLAVGKTSKPVTVELDGADPVRVTYGGFSGAGKRDGVRVRLRPKDVQAGLLVIAGGAVSAQTGSFAIEACDAVVIGDGPRPVRLEFGEPMNIEVRKVDDTGFVAEFTRPFESGKALSFALRTSLIDMMAAATTALAQGREALARNDYGAAFRYLQRVTDRYAVKREDIEEAQRLIAKVETDFEARRKALGRRVEEATFFKDPRQIDTVLADAKALADAYRETKAHDAAQALVDKLVEARVAVRADQMKDYAERTLTLARDFKERGSVRFAERYYGAIIERCKDTEWAATAKKELAELQKVVRELK